MDTGEFESEGLAFTVAPDSELNDNVRMGRPRDTRYDDIVRKAYDEGIAQRSVVAETQVDDVIRGIKRGAKHLDISVSYTVTPLDEDDVKYVIEFIAYPTRRKGVTENG